MNPINVPFSQDLFALAIEANHVQNHKWMWEVKCRRVERLQYQIWEYVCAIVDKMCKKYRLN